MKRDFLRIKDLTRDEIYKIFDITKKLKNQRKKNRIFPVLKGLSIGLLFTKPSTRTRVSFEVAIYELGGNSIYLSGETTQISRGETVKDTAKVLSRYIDGLIIRTYEQEEVEEFAKWSNFPVINALTDLLHPCQVLADFFTIYEKKGTLKNIKITYIGDGNNVCHSLILGADLLGIEIRISCPEKYMPSEKILKQVENKNLVKIDTNPERFIQDADVIYTDTWVSMGDEKEAEERKKIFKSYQVNRKLLESTKKDFIFMHCLPAHRGWEVEDEIIDGKNSVVFDQAENRLHTQKALLCFLYHKL
ncbi:ornithine carbamoyltransferase [bacterium]|nr:ornithine carbamoyltransferase [bacterium]